MSALGICTVTQRDLTSLQLISIKTQLIAGDSILCNQLLVNKYPDNVDVRHVIALALHIRDPMNHDRPIGSAYKMGTMWVQDVASLRGRAVAAGLSSPRSRNSREDAIQRWCEISQQIFFPEMRPETPKIPRNINSQTRKFRKWMPIATRIHSIEEGCDVL